ncbi:hypothetical protein HV183_15360 [Citrobacter freundii]|uniref:Lipoprotein n=1 Tax=Citrobacter freundii TaxID=546 RepID=A0AAE7KZI3_CITFR|nr:hypothetical protein [Citrobacter freundii]QLO14697.1 hypothetical protein HV183_15360 [Citrobacter freundii]
MNLKPLICLVFILLTGCVVGPYGGGVAFINPISLITAPKDYGTEITNLEYDELKKIEKTSGNIKVSLISKEGVKPTTAMILLEFRRNDREYGILKYKVSHAHSANGSYNIPAINAKNKDYYLSDITVIIGLDSDLSKNQYGGDWSRAYVVRINNIEFSEGDDKIITSNNHNLHIVNCSKSFADLDNARGEHGVYTVQIEAKYYDVALYNRMGYWVGRHGNSDTSI